MRVLAVNAGSSSVKLTLLDDEDRTVAARELEAPNARIDAAALERALVEDGLGETDAVVHRIVHGGTRFAGPVRIDAAIERELRSLAELAPLHQAKSLDALDAVSGALPDSPAVACFDTAFHTTLPPAASTYALPLAWRRRWRLRRYGFHGLSHAWIAHRVPELIDRSAGELRIVSAHLGSGASLCAIAGGRSVDTTMGFTPLEGLVMGTRCGSVDPGLLLWLLERETMTEPEMATALEHQSGLRGLAGTPDMRELLRRSRAGNERARIAIDVYIHRLRGSIAQMAAALGGLDVLAFTGGVGENAAPIRASAVAALAFLGLELDPALNEASREDRDVSAPAAGARTVVVRAREDLEMVRQARAVLAR